LLGVAGVLVALLLVVLPGRAAAAVGPAFNPANPTVFISENPPTAPSNTQLNSATQANGALTFNSVGPVSSINYNGIAYDPVNNYLYASQNVGVFGTPGNGEIMQIGSDGVPSDTGLNMSSHLGGLGSAAAGWDPDNGQIYWASSGTGTIPVNTALAAFNPATGTITGPITLSQTFVGEDLTWSQGYFWAWGGDPITPPPYTIADTFISRVDPTTGTVTNFPVNATQFPGCTPSCGAGSDWTYGNGNLGFDENSDGNIYQISISNPSSASPTFKLVSRQQGFPSGNIDATANPGLPTDLAMHKTATSQVPDGGQITYTLTVSNNGPGNSSGYTVSDTLPAGLSNPKTTTPGCSITAGVLTCSGNPLNAGATSSPITVTGTVPNPFTSPITNCSPVTANEQDPNTSNNTACVTTNPQADLSIAKSASPSPQIPGTDETYTLTVKNNGPDTAIAAKASDPLPKGLTFVSTSQGCTFASGTVSCAAGNLAAGASKAFTVTAKVASSATSCAASGLSNTATVSSSTQDPNTANNSASSCPPVAPKSHLAMSKAASAPTVTAGGQVMYTLVINNTGPSDATGASVSDPTPAGLSPVSAKSSQGSCSIGASGVTCSLGTVAGGGSAQVLVTANVSPSAAGQTVSECATATSKTKGAGVTGACAPIVVPQPPTPPQPTSDLRIVKHANHHKVTVGQTLIYTLKVTNHGPDTASNAKITDTASKRLKVLSAKTGHGKCRVSGTVLRCSLGTIANGKAVKITVKAKVNKVGTERNAASTTSSSKDPKPGNNLSKVKAKIAKKAKAVLHVRKIASRKTITAGDSITYHIKVSTSKADAHKVKVCDALPLGLSFSSAKPKAKLSKGKECWTIKTLGKGKSRTFTVHARALKGTSGRKTNHATATAKGAKTGRGKATVRVKPAPKPPATPVTGGTPASG
jgi:uncharacterized repeat protein (TIGR01451 family)